MVSGRFDKFPLITDITNVHVDYKEIGTYSMLVYHRGQYRGIMLVDARVVGSHKCALFDYAKTDTDWLTFTSEFRELFIPIHVEGYNTIPLSIAPPKKENIMGACMQLGKVISHSVTFGHLPGSDQEWPTCHSCTYDTGHGPGSQDQQGARRHRLEDTVTTYGKLEETPPGAAQGLHGAFHYACDNC